MACSPRDQAPLNGSRNNGPGGGGINLSSGQTITVDKEGEKLSSCSDGPTWSTIRFYYEVNFIFEKLKQNDVTIIVAKGSSNCLKISNNTPVEFETQKEPMGKDYNKTGVKVYVQKMQIMNTSDLLARTDLLAEYANGMGMTVGELISFLKQEPYKDQVNITFVSKTASAPGDNGSDNNGGTDDTGTTPSLGGINILRLPQDQGKTISECASPWTDVRVFKEVVDTTLSKIADRSLEVYVSQGDRSCLPIGNIAFFTSQDDSGQYVKVENSDFQVRAVVVRAKSDFVADPTLAEYVAEDMGLTVEAFMTYLSGMNKDQVNLTYINWDVEEPQDEPILEEEEEL